MNVSGGSGCVRGVPAGAWEPGLGPSPGGREPVKANWRPRNRARGDGEQDQPVGGSTEAQGTGDEREDRAGRTTEAADRRGEKEEPAIPTF